MTSTAATGIASPPFSGSGALTFSNNITFSGTFTVSGAASFTSSTAVNCSTAGIRTIQSTDNVTEAAPTDAELDSAFGTPASLGRGFIGTIDCPADLARLGSL